MGNKAALLIIRAKNSEYSGNHSNTNATVWPILISVSLSLSPAFQGKADRQGRRSQSQIGFFCAQRWAALEDQTCKNDVQMLLPGSVCSGNKQKSHRPEVWESEYHSVFFFQLALWVWFRFPGERETPGERGQYYTCIGNIRLDCRVALIDPTAHAGKKLKWIRINSSGIRCAYVYIRKLDMVQICQIILEFLWRSTALIYRCIYCIIYNSSNPSNPKL